MGTPREYLARALAKVFFQGRRLRTIIVSSDIEARKLQLWLEPRNNLGIDAIGYVTPDADGVGEGRSWLGPLSALPEIAAREAADLMVVSRIDFSPIGANDLVRSMEKARCRVRFFVNLASLFGDKFAEVEHKENYAFAAGAMEPLDSPINQLLKRGLDVAVALPVVLFVLPPLIVVVWVMQRRQSPGPVFFRQQRSGLNRKHFSLFKFRTMHCKRGVADTTQATVADTRVFPFGRFLRRTSLDEMPQFLNVLVGSMSVSGPRPHMVEHDEQFGRLERTYFKRHFVKPGITGLAQSKGYRGELVAPDDLANRIRFDELYVANWSFGLDVSILMSTARQVLAPPRSAY